MADLWAMIKRSWRVGVAGFLVAVINGFGNLNLDWYWLPTATAVINGIWKLLRVKYPDYWLWKLM